jgi:hypothetical protein
MRREVHFNRSDKSEQGQSPAVALDDVLKFGDERAQARGEELARLRATAGVRCHWATASSRFSCRRDLHGTHVW